MAKNRGTLRRIGQGETNGSSRSRSYIAIMTLLAFIGSTLATLVVTALPASATGEDNKDCPEGYDFVAKAEWTAGGYVWEDNKPNGVTITGNTQGGTFTSTTPISAVVVKGSTDQEVIYYTPPVTSGSFDNDDLTTSSGQEAAISHVTFCSQPPTKVAVPAKPSYQDPCGPDNATWTVPADTDELDWTLEADGDLVVATKPGYVFEDGTTSKNFGKAPDSGVKCTVPVPPAPSQTDPCGPNNASWNVPADTADYDWTLRPDGHLVVTVKGDKTFPDGSTSKDYGLPTDSNEPCPDQSVPVPAKPGMNDPCGPNNATWIKPADTASVVWVLEADGDLVASTTPGYVFENGQKSINFGKAVDSNTPCPDTQVPVPAAPSQNDPCGPNNATWNVPADTDQLDWTLGADGRLTVATKPGYVFADGTSSKDFGLPTDSNVPCTTSPPPTCPPGSPQTDLNGNGVIEPPHECVPPTPTPEPEPKKVKGAAKMVDKCGTVGDLLAVRKGRGVVYFADGERIREGVWLSTGGDRKVVIKAKAASKKFKLVGKTRWVFRFDNRPCGNPDVPPPTGARLVA